MKIAILGTGPSGLVAAWACHMHRPDYDVTLFSPGVRSDIFGAQYLHQPIPGVSGDQPGIVRYQMDGQAEKYLWKVYQEKWDGSVSDELRDQAHLSWDLRMAYARLWQFYHGVINKMELGNNPEANRNILGDILQSYEMVVNTIPRNRLCLHPRGHEFRKTEIWAMGDSNSQQIPFRPDEGKIIYNGQEAPSWYRAAMIYGYGTLEWPGHINRPPIPGVVRVPKPINHNCDCWPGFIHLGRMGRWDKSRHVHEVYTDMVEQLMITEEMK